MDNLVGTTPKIPVDGSEPGLKVGHRIDIRLIIIDAQASSQVYVLDDHPVSLKAGHDVIDLGAFQLHNILNIKDLRADVELKPVEIDVRASVHQGHGLVKAPVGDSELVLVQAGSDVVMRVGVDVRVDPKADGSPAAKPARQVTDDLDLLKRLHHEGTDADLKGLAYLPVGLSDSREENLPGIVAAPHGEFNLVTAHAVRSKPLVADDVVETAVRIGLYRIMHLYAGLFGKIGDLVHSTHKEVDVIVVKRCRDPAEGSIIINSQHNKHSLDTPPKASALVILLFVNIQQLQK